MRRVGVTGVLVAACGALLAAVVVAGAPASETRRSAGSTLTLQSQTAAECSKGGTVLLGQACVDKRGMVLADKWTVGSGSAAWNTDQWQTTYGWSVPQTIPPAGASMTLKLGATELTKNPGARICPAMGVRGGVDLKVGGVSQGQPVTLGLCAQSGSSASDQKTVKLVPPAAAPGSAVFLTVGIQDGPSYTYKYEAAAAGGKCRKLSAVGATPKCRYSVKFVFTQGGRRPKGMPSWVTDVVTAGTGKAEFEDEERRQFVQLEKLSVRVVRTMEIARSDPDTGVAIRDVKLVFGRLHPRSGNWQADAVAVSLLLVASDDPLCPEAEGEIVEATLVISEGGARGVDRVRLTVPLCPHHSAVFTGSKGPNSAVKVAIVVKPI